MSGETDEMSLSEVEEGMAVVNEALENIEQGQAGMEPETQDEQGNGDDNDNDNEDEPDENNNYQDYENTEGDGADDGEEDGDNGGDGEGDGGADQLTLDGSNFGSGLDLAGSFAAASSAAKSNSTKWRERSNAKAVECFDVQGNFLKTYFSGANASKELGVPQGDISLCCRGLKTSAMGYRFRFVGSENNPSEPLKVKRGFALVPDTEKPAEVSYQRTTRASRGEYGNARISSARAAILATAAIKVSVYN